MKEAEWLLCSVCGNKIRNTVKVDTEHRNFPLLCPKCNSSLLSASGKTPQE